MILSIIGTFENILDNIKIFISDILSIFPAEIVAVSLSVFGIILALYIYRLLR